MMSYGNASADLGSARSDFRRQLPIYAALLAVYAILIFATYALVPLEMLQPAGAPAPTPELPGWQLGLINAAVVTLLYGLLGMAGYWLARKLGMPGIVRIGATPREWGLVPLALGAAVGLGLVVTDRVFAVIGDWSGFGHPAFPLSVLASGTAGIGEEIIFRLFVLSLWAFLLNLVLGRIGASGVAFWAGNAIAALAFAAAHLPTAMMLLNVATPADLPGIVLAELLLLNGIIGLVCGWQFRRVGLVAAVGVHFWADIVWHVLLPLSGL